MRLRRMTHLTLGLWFALASTSMGFDGHGPPPDRDEGAEERPWNRAAPPASRFFVQVGRDFQNLFSSDHHLLLGVGSASALAVSRFDSSIAKSSFSTETAGGTLAGRAVSVGSGRARFAMAPLVVADGGGVELTWVGMEPSR